MCHPRRLLLWATGMLALAIRLAQADSGDVAGSHDYTGFPRPPGFVITDFDEDNPAEFDFPVARPLPIDSDHVETVHVKGHRYVIRYEHSDAGVPTLLETQKYYEKLALDAGFAMEKSGAVGDVTETFHKATPGHEVWIYLEPAVTEHALTIMESSEAASSQPVASTTNTPVRFSPPIATKPAPVPEYLPAPAPASLPAKAAPSVPVDPLGDSLYADLSKDGRVVFPITFLRGKNEVDDSSRPQIDRIVAMMKRHPEILLRIESHTDDLGDREDNLRISAQRAFAVRDLLVNADIDVRRLDAVGVGGLQPIADNKTAQGREKNQRIELVLQKKRAVFHASAPNGKNYYPAEKP